MSSLRGRLRGFRPFTSYVRKGYESVTVYGLADPRSGHLRYIGQTARPLRERLNGHLSESSLNYCPAKGRWVRELFAAGLRPEIFAIEEGVLYALRHKEEDFWIDYFAGLGADLLNFASETPDQITV
jgi:hypothetical protein